MTEQYKNGEKINNKFIFFGVLFFVFNSFLCIYNFTKTHVDTSNILFVVTAISLVLYGLSLIFATLIIKPIFNFLYKKSVPKPNEERVRVGRYGFQYTQKHVSKEKVLKRLKIFYTVSCLITFLIGIIVFILLYV